MRSIFPFLTLYRHHWGRLCLGILLFIVGLTASIGLLSLSGWFLAASALVGSSLVFNFFYPSSGVRGLAIGRTISRYFERLVTHDATFRVLANLRVTIFSKLVPLTPAKLRHYQSSELLQRLVADVDTLDAIYLNLITPFISAVAVTIFMAIGLSFFSPLLAWIICGGIAILLFLLPITFYRLGRKTGKNIVKTRADYRNRFIEWIEMNAEFILFDKLEIASQRLKECESIWLKNQSQESQLMGLSNAILIVTNGILVIITIWLVATAVHFPDSNTAEALIALIVFCVLASFEILMPISGAFLHLGQMITAAERLHEMTNQSEQVTFNGNAQWEAIVDNRPLISFKQVSFAYPDAKQAIFSGLNFDIYPKQKVAILGRTGSGKSTIFQLLVRNYDPTSGQIVLNNHSINTYPEKILRQQIGILSQRVHIFSGSLRENLLIGNQQASDVQLKQILIAVGLANLLETEEHLDLWLGDGGRPLSGGEQRRLGLARLLLSDAHIILLDEPSEGLDRETERNILSLIFELCSEKTLIVITHRLAKLSEFDCIYTLEAGKLNLTTI